MSDEIKNQDEVVEAKAPAANKGVVTPEKDPEKEKELPDEFSWEDIRMRAYEIFKSVHGKDKAEQYFSQTNFNEAKRMDSISMISKLLSTEQEQALAQSFGTDNISEMWQIINQKWNKEVKANAPEYIDIEIGESTFGYDLTPFKKARGIDRNTKITDTHMKIIKNSLKRAKMKSKEISPMDHLDLETIYQDWYADTYINKAPQWAHNMLWHHSDSMVGIQRMINNYSYNGASGLKGSGVMMKPIITNGDDARKLNKIVHFGGQNISINQLRKEVDYSTIAEANQLLLNDLSKVDENWKILINMKDSGYGSGDIKNSKYMKTVMELGEKWGFTVLDINNLFKPNIFTSKNNPASRVRKLLHSKRRGDLKGGGLSGLDSSRASALHALLAANIEIDNLTSEYNKHYGGFHKIIAKSVPEEVINKILKSKK